MKKYDYDQFYPTPLSLIKKMYKKVKGNPEYILDPSAGKGDILKFFEENYNRQFLYAIEIDQEKQSILRSNRFRVIDSNFLEYQGRDKFDLIIANPPFNTGYKHLLKAIEIMYNGEIVFLLNAETVKHPDSKAKKEFIKVINDLGADIEYIKGCFESAERKTKVEVALIYIEIENKIEDDIFKNMESVREDKINISENKKLAMDDKILAKVREYEFAVDKGTKVILDYYSVFDYIGEIIKLSINDDTDSYNEDRNITLKVQGRVNNFLQSIRGKYWKEILKLPAIRSRLTQEKINEFVDQKEKYSFMEFTENNIRQIIMNLISGLDKTISDSVTKLFDKITNAAYHEKLNNDNIHMFDGWKTNHAFKVREKFIIPIYGSYGSAFIDYSGNWKLDYTAKEVFRDIEIVMNYLSGENYNGCIVDNIDKSFSEGKNRKINTYHFTIDIFKKGTAHFRFKDKDVLRRFNVIACREKGWLPYDYCNKNYSNLSKTEKETAKSFEGKESYNNNLGKDLLEFKALDLELLEANTIL